MSQCHEYLLASTKPVHGLQSIARDRFGRTLARVREVLPLHYSLTRPRDRLRTHQSSEVQPVTFFRGTSLSELNRPGGEIGRRTGLKIPGLGRGVRVRPPSWLVKILEIRDPGLLRNPSVSASVTEVSLKPPQQSGFLILLLLLPTLTADRRRRSSDRVLPHLASCRNAVSSASRNATPLLCSDSCHGAVHTSYSSGCAGSY